MWLKISCAQRFWFCNSNVTTFQTRENVKISIFPFTTVPAEMLYLQKYLTNLQKLFFGWKMRKVAIGVENFLCTEIWFCNSNVTTFQNPENVKISIFPFTLSREKCYIFKSILRIFKNFLFAERWGRWLLWLKISCAQRFWFCNSNVTTFQTRENVKFQFLPLHCPGRNAISSKVFNEFTKTFFWLKEEEGGYWGWKFLVHRYLVLQ